MPSTYFTVFYPPFPQVYPQFYRNMRKLSIYKLFLEEIGDYARMMVLNKQI